VAPNVVLAGQVTVWDGSSVWNGAVLRGDRNKITGGFCSNVQDRCVVHAAWSSPTGYCFLPSIFKKNCVLIIQFFVWNQDNVDWDLGVFIVHFQL
jgi:carbonic anhydrase/acetyltransferase-like protein (isoleucine patch superfamily)